MGELPRGGFAKGGEALARREGGCQGGGMPGVSGAGGGKEAQCCVLRVAD